VIFNVAELLPSSGRFIFAAICHRGKQLKADPWYTNMLHEIKIFL